MCNSGEKKLRKKRKFAEVDGVRIKLSAGETAVLAVTAVLVLVMLGYSLVTGRTVSAEFSHGSGTAASSVQQESGEDRVDINTAGVEELMTLPGIGETRARAIVEYRAEHGPFAYVEDLIGVPGIGEGILEDILDCITAGGA